MPIVGCPATSISRFTFRAKIRTRKSVPGPSAGNTKVVSENPISRVSASISSAVNPVGSRNTASWFPVSGCSVNTSR